LRLDEFEENYTPERAVFDYGRLEITRKWGKMNELEMNL
jgi:hypothetical protein